MAYAITILAVWLGVGFLIALAFGAAAQIGETEAEKELKDHSYRSFGP